MSTTVPITDLPMVCLFAGDFILLKPVDLSNGNHRLLYDVNNRGNLLMLSYYNNAAGSNRPTTHRIRRDCGRRARSHVGDAGHSG